MKRYYVVVLAGLLPGTALAQSPEHVAAVRHAQQSAYAITDSTNSCPAIGTDIFGWPGSLVRKCAYVEGPKQNQVTGIVFLIDVKPEIIARWIERSIARPFRLLHHCPEMRSREFRNDVCSQWQRYGEHGPENVEEPLFSHGMTVKIDGEKNGSTVQIPIDRQEALAMSPDKAIISIPSGVTRFWRTLPRQFAARFPEVGAPSSLASPTARPNFSTRLIDQRTGF